MTDGDPWHRSHVAAADQDRAVDPGGARDPRQLFLRILLFASMIAAAVSLLTTGIGLDQYVSFPLAWSMAVAVQLGLFGLAWLIGAGHASSSRRDHRGWIIALYAVTMLFSVTFSYVTLQSEFTAEIRPAEAQRRLFDASRTALAENAQRIQSGVRQSDDLTLRLESWLDMERRDGWATRTCEEEDHCYLEGVCDRIRRRIERWEQESGKTYREGPGEKMIFSTLETELQTLEQLQGRLTAYGETLSNGDVLDDGLDNRERLRRLDRTLVQAPLDDLEAVTCQAAPPSVLPAYGDHARDHAAGDEQPVYAFQDLVELLSGVRPFGREDYPTVFALALAFFIDGFVLVVALGASTLQWHRTGPELPILDRVPGNFERALRRDIDRWIDAALLDRRGDPEARRGFLSALLGNISFGRGGEARLVPETDEQTRFGHLLVQSRAARLGSFVQFNRTGRLFLLEDWLYAALAHHSAADEEARALG